MDWPSWKCSKTIVEHSRSNKRKERKEGRTPDSWYGMVYLLACFHRQREAEGQRRGDGRQIEGGRGSESQN